MSKIKSLLKDGLVWTTSKYQNRWRHVSNKPTEVHLMVTESCCLKCKMCNIWKLRNIRKPLNLNQALKIIDILHLWLGEFNLTFAGGEPFLNTDLIDIIKYARSKHIHTSLNSNGYVINQPMAEKIIASDLNKIYFSIDGLEKEHNHIRGKNDSFQRVIQAVDLINKLRTDKRIKIYINSVISQNNLSQITKLVQLAEDKKIDGINFQALMPNFATKYSPNWYEKDPYWPKNKHHSKKQLNKLIKLKQNLPNFIINTQSELKKFSSYFIDPKLFQETEACFVGLNNMMIDTTGNVRLCYEMESIGNILTEPPQTIWKSNQAMIARKAIAACQRPCKILPCNDMRTLHMIKRWIKL